MKTVSNPDNRFTTERRERLELPTPVALSIREERARTILSRNDSPDLPFTWSLNPYRGCFHGCAYCYARSTHEYADLGAGTDFETRLTVKLNAPQLLRRTFDRPSWTGDLILFSGNTDCYQPLEAKYRLTRACLDLCRSYRNPVAIITKSSLVTRDRDLLKALHHAASVQVFFSIPFADDSIARKLEPQAPSISARLHAMRDLSDAGIPTGVSIAPVIPGLNVQDIPRILRQAREAGASTATWGELRLDETVHQVFLECLTRHFPDRRQKIMNQRTHAHQTPRSAGRTATRDLGNNPMWDTMEQLFRLHSRKAGFTHDALRPTPNTFQRPHARQLDLFSSPAHDSRSQEPDK